MAALPFDALDQLFRQARTFNAWTDRAVDDATIASIYDLVRMAPTSANTGPARFVWVRTREARQRLADCAMEPNAAKIMAAPVTVIVARDMDFVRHMDLLFPHNPGMQTMLRENSAMRTATAVRNTTLQGAYLIMAARALGLDCGPMSGFDAAAVDAAFLAGTACNTDFICTMGYGAPEGLHPRLPRLPFAAANTLV